MHYHCEVWIPDKRAIESRVKKAMKPFQDWDACDESNPQGIWDWYVIGGRYKKREEMEPDGRFPANNPKDNLTPVSEITEDFDCFTLIVNGKAYFSQKVVGEYDEHGEWIIGSGRYVEGDLGSVK